MKKIILFVATALISTVSMAQQTDKLKVLAGGIFNMGFGSSDLTKNYTAGNPTKSSLSTFDLSLTPDAGVFLFKNFALGIQLELTAKNQKDSLGTSSSSSFNIGPFVRYYYKIRNFAPFLQLSYGTGTISSSGASTSKGNVLGIGPGFAYFFNDRIGIEALLNYQHLSQTTDINIGGVLNTKNVGNNLKFNIGLQVYL